MNSQLTYKKNTTYAFTLEAQFVKSTKLIHGENIIFKTKIRLYLVSIIEIPGYFILTNKRILFIKHYLLKPDTIISIDFGDIKGIKFNKTSMCDVIFSLRRHYFITVTYLNKQIHFYKFSNKYWSTSEITTEELYNKTIDQYQNKE